MVQDITRLGEIYATPEAKMLFHAPSHDPNQLALSLRGNPAQVAQIVKTARDFSHVASDCLQMNLCNQEAPETGFFDPHNTRIHAMLNESLEFMKAAEDLDGAHDGLPDSDELLGNMKVENGKTQLLSMELLMDRGAAGKTRGAA